MEPRDVVVACVASIAGLVAHNVMEFPPEILVRPETLVPLAVTLAIAWALIARPGRVSALAATTWALIVVVVGGGSVLPFGFWPFEPEQSVSHYLAHLVYVVAQIPLLWVAWRQFRRKRPLRAARTE